VGSEEVVRPLIGERTLVIALGGRRVVPGFHDSHVHFLGGGLSLARVQLKDAPDEAEFGRRLQEFDRKLPRDRWLLGGDWDHDRTFAGKLPAADIVDRYVPARPVFLRRYDGHMALVNSVALKMAGIDAATPDPPGGEIVRKPGSREPTGILRDNAMDLVARLVPEPADEEIVEALQAAMRECARFGVTSVEDMDGSPTATRRRLLAAYQRAAREHKLTVRIGLWWPLAEWQALAQLGVQRGYGNDWVRLGGVKGFVDGSLGSSTAKMFEPYVHEPNNTGVFVTPPARLEQWIRQADAADLQIAVHAIGDRANAELLDIYERVAPGPAARSRRFRVEHAQHLCTGDWQRFGQLGVIASMQPYHIVDDGRWAEARIGRERCARSYMCRSLHEAGAVLAFGSDWPVAPLDPLAGIAAAVHRRTLDGRHPQGWFPAQRISVETALQAYTLGSAYAAGVEKDRGTLEVSKAADLVVLSRDILDPAEIECLDRAAVLLTVVGGRVVHIADPSLAPRPAASAIP